MEMCVSSFVENKGKDWLNSVIDELELVKITAFKDALSGLTVSTETGHMVAVYDLLKLEEDFDLGEQYSIVKAAREMYGKDCPVFFYGVNSNMDVAVLQRRNISSKLSCNKDSGDWCYAETAENR